MFKKDRIPLIKECCKPFEGSGIAITVISHKLYYKNCKFENAVFVLIFSTLTGNNDIGCDCYLLESMTVVESIIVGGACGAPPVAITLAGGISLDSGTSGSLPHFLSAEPAIFLCCMYDN